MSIPAPMLVLEIPKAWGYEKHSQMPMATWPSPVMWSPKKPSGPSKAHVSSV